MGLGVNFIGAYVVKHRHERGWTQDMLAAKLQLLGCDITAQVLANIETQRCGASDTEIGYLAKAFEIGVEELFPPKWRGQSSAKKSATQSAASPKNQSRSSE